MKAALLLRDGPAYRREAFAQGLRAIGYEVDYGWPTSPSVVVTWNRYGRFDEYCKRVEKDGVPVIVVENGYFGKDQEGGPWFAMALGQHAGAGQYALDASGARWAALGLQPLPLQRPPAGRVLRGLALGQRSIGRPGICSPPGWAAQAAQKLRAFGCQMSVREHPGDLAAQRAAPDLRKVIREFDFVATWNSGAAIKAMLWGVPVLHEFPQWVARFGGLPMCKDSLSNLSSMEDRRDEAFAHIASAQAHLSEIVDGSAFTRLLEGV